MNKDQKQQINWSQTDTVVAFLGFLVIIVWFSVEPGFEPLAGLLGFLTGVSILRFFGLRPAESQKWLDTAFSAFLLIFVPLLLMIAVSVEKASSADPPAIQTVVAYLQTVESINGTLTAIPQTVAALEGQGSAPTATALANQQTELESTRNAIPTAPAASTIPAAQLTLTPLVAIINSTASAVSANKVALTNPTSGQLVHDQDGLLEEKFSPVSVKNFETQVKFLNPYDARIRGFDFGIIFRIGVVDGSDTCKCYRLQVNSDGRWQLVLAKGVRPTLADTLYSETFDLAFLNTGEGEVNELQLIVHENDAYFYLNGNYIAKLNVSDRLDAGGISVATGLRTNHEFSGFVTTYEDFTIWQILDE